MKNMHIMSLFVMAIVHSCSFAAPTAAVQVTAEVHPFAYGLYHFMTSGNLYFAYFSNDHPFAVIAQIEIFGNLTLATDVDSHNFKELGSSQHLYTEHNDSVYVAIGEDVIELVMNGDIPSFNLIPIGHIPTQIDVNTRGSRTFLKVYYEENGRGFVATYDMRKYNNNTSLRAWKKINNETEESYAEVQQKHDVTSRSQKIRGAFVTVSSILHYFCYIIEDTEFGIKCINVTHAVLNNGDGSDSQILPNTSSIACSSDANCPILCSYQRYLVVKIEEEGCLSTIMLFDLSTLENTVNITGHKLCRSSIDSIS